MKRYGIFQMVVTKAENVPTISFKAIINPTNTKEPLVLKAEGLDDALTLAKELLKMLGVTTHSFLGNPDTVMRDFPDYFVGEFDTQSADFFDTPSLENRICSFAPVPNAKK